MTLLVTLTATAVLVVLLQKQIRKYPVIFYAICIALDILLMANVVTTLPREIRIFTTAIMHKGTLGVAMFLIVMWIGVFPRNGYLSKSLRPIRAELSIMACLLIAGHMIMYFTVFMPKTGSWSFASTNVMVAFIIAMALTILILLLGGTSFRAIKKKMHARSWKKLQTLAYPFYGMILLHLLFMLGPAAFAGGGEALFNVAIYTILFVGYIAARIWRAIIDKRENIDLAETVKDQGFTS